MGYQTLVRDGSKYKIAGTPQNLKNGCWMTGRDFGDNRISATKECISADGKAICTECVRYIHFYEKVEELEQSGIRFGEAVRMVKTE